MFVKLQKKTPEQLVQEWASDKLVQFGEKMDNLVKQGKVKKESVSYMIGKYESSMTDLMKYGLSIRHAYNGTSILSTLFDYDSKGLSEFLLLAYGIDSKEIQEIVPVSEYFGLETLYAAIGRKLAVVEVLL